MSIPAGTQFATVTRTWQPNDRVTLRFPMAVKVKLGRETPYPQVSYFQSSRRIARKTDISSPYASVYLGPLLFSLAIPDEGPNQAAANAHFNYALDITAGNARSKVKIVRRTMPARWIWGLDAPVQLVADFKAFDWRPTELEPLPERPVEEGKKVKVALVPYGCAKFRVSMFPVTKTAEEASPQ